jgi:hypothetical protein
MVAYMMAAKFMHINLRSIIDTSNKEEPSSSTAAAPFSCERSTLHHDNTQPRKASLPSIIPEQLPSPPTSPTSDPLNYHYFSATKDRKIPPPPPSSQQPERHFQILRMELEFLHFLNYDLSVSETIKLIHWAQKFDDDILPPIKNAEEANDEHLQHAYSSGDEGGDELDNNTED